MAKQAYQIVPITLQDGTDLTIAPLVIGRLKRFMREWKKFDDIDLEGDPTAAFDIYVNCAGISLDKELKKAGKVEETKGEGDDPLHPDYREYLEDTLDMDTIFKVMEVCGGLKLNDPNLLRAVTEAQLGKN